MDLGFRRLDALRPDIAPVPLDYYRLAASLGAMQAASRTATVEGMVAAGTFVNAHPVLAMARLFGAGPGWFSAVATLGGSFHPGSAPVNRDQASHGR